MRILHLITRLILGGAQENTLLTCEGLHERGHEVCLATGPETGPEGALTERALRGGYRVEFIDSMRREIDPVCDLAATAEMLSLIRRWRPEIIHTHSSKAGILGRLAAKLAGAARPRPTIIHTLHGLAFGATASPAENAVYVPLERLAATWSHGLISVADAMTAQALAAGVGRPGQYVTIHSGMETAAFLDAPRLREAVRAELGVGPGELVVGQVARLAPRKGYEDVLAAAARLCSARPELRFCLVGDGPLRGQLEDTVRRTRLTGRLLFAGLVPPDRVPGLMAAFDVLVHASVREGLPRVLPQALLAGTPAVCCGVDGAPEVIVPGVRGGFLFDPHDVDGMVAGLQRLLDDPALRRSLAESGREWCRVRFDWRLMAERIEAEYVRRRAEMLREGR
jgi:glycosyltransferase involved in cell wall biosynthesis